MTEAATLRTSALAVAFTVVLLAIAGSFALVGWDDGDRTLPPNSRNGGNADGRSLPAGPEKAGSWLEIDDQESPSAFLARMTQSDLAAVDATFPVLAARYRESPRMIANRTLQIWQIARESRDGPALPDLLRDLARLPDAASGLSLGSVTQLYRVQRDSGVGHSQALKAALEEAH